MAISTVSTEFETVIGLEVHAQLKTRSKMFCACPADYQDAPPNSRVCPVCLGLPGALPVINREAVRAVIMTGLALHSSVSVQTKFDRKNYNYPDLMKGYQVSQYDLPLCTGGYLEFPIPPTPGGPGTKRCGITRVHLEEDVAKLFHRTDAATGEGYGLLDVNRSGVPLMEMVGEPDLRSPEEARRYLMAYRAILQFIGVSDADMEAGNFRCDANVSLRPRGSTTLGTKVEVKNMNSFRSVYRALVYEAERQGAMLRRGERVPQETRGWLEDRGETMSLRSKEQAHDYRYFPEPDLPPLHISREWVNDIAERMPELPADKRARFMSAYGLSAYDADMLTLSPATARYYESVVDAHRQAYGASVAAAKTAANWTVTELGRLLNDAHVEIQDSKVTPRHMADLVGLLERGTIGTAQAKTVIEEMFSTGKDAAAVVRERALAQISDAGALVESVRQAIEANPQAVDDYRKGKEAAVKFLVGQVMKLTKGKANPTVVADVIKGQLQAQA